MGFPGGSDGKETACNAGDPGSVSGLGGYPGEGNGNQLQCSCLENSMDRGTWWATVHVVRVGHNWANKHTHCCSEWSYNSFLKKQRYKTWSLLSLASIHELMRICSALWLEENVHHGRLSNRCNSRKTEMRIHRYSPRNILELCSVMQLSCLERV